MPAVVRLSTSLNIFHSTVQTVSTVMAFSRAGLILGGMACIAAATSPPVQPDISCTTTTICSSQTPSPGCQGPNCPPRPPFGAGFPWNQQPPAGQQPVQPPGEQPGQPPGQNPGYFHPGYFHPGQYTPGQYTPGQYTPGQYTPGQFHPGQYTPGHYDPGQFDPGQFIPGNPKPGQKPGLNDEPPGQGYPCPECPPCPPCSCEPTG